MSVKIAHTGWQVTSIDPSAYQVAADGSPINGSRVRFTTGAGNQGSVFVREQDFTPANVGALIDTAAAMLDQVLNLQAAPTGEV